MSTERWIEFCRANNIPSLALREMPPQMPGGPQNVAEPDVLHNKTLAEAPRIEPPPGEDLSYLCNNKHQKLAKDWWLNMGAEQRAIESAKRRENGKGMRKG